MPSTCAALQSSSATVAHAAPRALPQLILLMPINNVHLAYCRENLNLICGEIGISAANPIVCD